MTDQDLIATDHLLDVAQRTKLSAMLEVLIPAHEERQLPSAGDVDVIGYLAREAPDHLATLCDALKLLDPSFEALTVAERYPVLQAFSEAHKPLFETLLFHTFACYYQDDRVLHAIGVDSAPPFPRGNEVTQGELSLLDPVIGSNNGYRRLS
jgi:hypothetical protein